MAQYFKISINQSNLYCKPKWVVTTQISWVINWVDSLRHTTYLIGNILPIHVPKTANNNPQKKKRKCVNSLLRPNCGSREFKIYVTSFLPPITTVLDCSLFAFLTSADSYVKLFDSCIKPQIMNNLIFLQCIYANTLFWEFNTQYFFNL